MILYSKISIFESYNNFNLGGNMKKSLLLLIVALLSFSATAQNSEKLTELINSKTATYGQVAYLYGVYSEKIDENASYEESFEVLKENFPLKKEISSSSPVTLSELSFICAKLADLKGGIFYTLFSNPHYAFKELQAKEILPENSDPSQKVNGRDVIAIFNGCLSQE